MIETTFIDIIKLLRLEISIQTGIDLNRIINAISARGPSLVKLISDTEMASFNLSDCFIVFELLETPDTKENVVIHDSNGVVTSVVPYDFSMKIYGNACHQVSQIILTKFKTESVALDLYSKGIFIHGITFPTPVNEFINNTVWQRCDMSIHIITEFRVQTEETSDAEISPELVIRTVE